MAFPDHCIRGIPHKGYVNPDGTIGAHLFFFVGKDAGDGWLRESINWQDDDSALDFTCNQTKTDGSPQFTGACTVPRLDLDRLGLSPLSPGLLSYERQPVPENGFHGNLLFRAGVEKLTMKMFGASLALAVESVVYCTDRQDGGAEEEVEG